MQDLHARKVVDYLSQFEDDNKFVDECRSPHLTRDAFVFHEAMQKTVRAVMGSAELEGGCVKCRQPVLLHDVFVKLATRYRDALSIEMTLGNGRVVVLDLKTFKLGSTGARD
jgi:hypothetical protein